MSKVSNPNFFTILSVLIMIVTGIVVLMTELNTIVLIILLSISIVLLTVSNQVNEEKPTLFNLLEIIIALTLLALLLIFGEELFVRILLIGLFVLNVYIFRKL
ncbi:hypothetical protein [Alkalibacillus silvisoli]|uniref:Uncharacterized protein n=1 Tax=Alkalibacillus silvisoli TaxID=392823 RepID=A0ABN0ZV67_9BACI